MMKLILKGILEKQANFLDPSFRICNPKFQFPSGNARQDGELQVLVVVPSCEAGKHAQKKTKATISGSKTISDEIQSIGPLDLDTWSVGGMTLGIHRIESDLPMWLYVRQEALDIIQVVKTQIQENRNTVFVGSPGVGKSIMVVQLAFYLALHGKSKRVVVLFRKIQAKGYSLLYLDAKGKQYWRIDKAEIHHLDFLYRRGQDFELCLDGLTHQEIQDHFGTLARFRLLATSSVHYPMENGDAPVLRQCLVPFWSKSGMAVVGKHSQWTDNEIEEKYFYSGGNLRAFLLQKQDAIESVHQALHGVDAVMAAMLLTTNAHSIGSWKQVVDDLWMATLVGADEGGDSQQNLSRYTMSRSWGFVVTSPYTLTQLSKMVKTL